MSVNPVPKDVDALRFKGKGNRETKGHKEKGKANKEKGTRSKSPDPKDVECYYCGNKSHKKSDCAQRKADLEKAKSKGRLAAGDEKTERRS